MAKELTIQTIKLGEKAPAKINAEAGYIVAQIRPGQLPVQCGMEEGTS